MTIYWRRLAGALLLALAGSARAADYAVTPAYYDNIQEILDQLGFAYDPIQEATLEDYDAIKNYKTIFLNCSGTADGSATDLAIENLRRFVDEGGTVYASDWAYIFIHKAWPGRIDFYDFPKRGNAQTAPASIMDSGMRDYVGASSIDLNFNLSAWVPIEDYDAKSVNVYLRGAGGDADVNGKAVLVQFNQGQGNVIFTAFHNEAGLGADAVKVLEYMVLISILRSTADQLAATLRGMGYIVTKENLNALGVGAASSNISFNADQTFDYAVAAAWRPNADFRLNVTTPSAPTQSTQSANSPLIFEASNVGTGTIDYNIELLSAADSQHAYVLMAARRTPAYPSLSVKTYPNPFKANEHDVFVFDGLPAQATIQIYTLTGARVASIRKDDSLGTYFWNVKNDQGEKLAAGIYIYVIQAGGRTAKGKLAILR